MEGLRILVTDSDARSALAAVRSLGRAGHHVVAAGPRHPSLASVSRYCAEALTYPDPAKDSAGFVRTIVDAASCQKIDVLMPMTEITTLLLTQNQERLPRHCKLPFPDDKSVSLASDKAHVLDLAHTLGVPIPATIKLDAPQDITTVAANLTYPVVIKPARSRVLVDGHFVSTSVAYALDGSDLERKVRALPEAVFPVLLQERIEGPGVGVFACFAEGRPVALFAHTRLREKPPSGGVSVLRESAPLDPVAVEHSERLLRALAWKGVAMVEFKRDQRDGSLRLMEINGRFWGSLQLAIDAGVDFPALLADIAVGRTPPPLRSYRVGVRTRWLWGDVDSLLQVLFRSHAQLNLPPTAP